MKLTPFGKAVRRHRLEKEITMMQLAERLGVSPAFLSAVETGSKPIPATLPKRVASALGLDMVETRELEDTAAISATEFTIGLHKNAPRQDREVAAMFAREFPGLTDHDKESIRRILEGRRK